MRAAKALHDLSAYVNYALELLPRDMPGNKAARFVFVAYDKFNIVRRRSSGNDEYVVWRVGGASYAGFRSFPCSHLSSHRLFVVRSFPLYLLLLIF